MNFSNLAGTQEVDYYTQDDSSIYIKITDDTPCTELLDEPDGRRNIQVRIESELGDLEYVILTETDEGDNLVQVNQGIYILNWAPGEMLNINTQKFRIAQSMEASMFEHKIN